MPIPAFSPDGALPPHLGNPVHPSDLSPFPATSVELCGRFNTSPERVAILRGFLSFREQLRGAGMTAGFQWLDGSFLEDIERTEGRAPRDLDVVTFYLPPTMTFNTMVAALRPDLTDRVAVKRAFLLDHFFVDMQAHPESVVEHARYWTHLFSHRRDKLWKGMLRLELNTVADDSNALKILGTPGP
jgi:hypothetical protein